MNPIRVAHITSDIVTVPYSYSFLMKKYGIESVIYRHKNENKYGANSGNPLNVDIRFLYTNPIQRFLQVLKINSEYDIVHLHDGGGMFESIFCGHGKAKVIYHFHGSAIREGMPNFTIYTKIRKKYWKYLGIHCKTIVSTEDLLPHWKGAELLLDPIDPTISNVQATRNIENPYILSSHYCDDGIKGTNKVFSAWNILKKKFPNYVIHIIDWGKDALYYKNLTKNDPSVVWHKFLPRDEFFKLLSGATVNWGEFIIPAYGLTELEAFILGVPDISESNISSVELAKCTEQLILDNNSRSEMVKKQKQIIKKYDPDILTRQLYNIYMGVLNVS